MFHGMLAGKGKVVSYSGSNEDLAFSMVTADSIIDEIKGLLINLRAADEIAEVHEGR